MRSDGFSLLRRMALVVGGLLAMSILVAQDDGKTKPKDGKDAKASKEKGKESGKDSASAPAGDKKQEPSVDEAYVKEKLKDLLFPTQAEFLENGKTHLVFDLMAKKDEHRTIFTPRVGDDLKDTLRWSKRDEESVVGGEAGLRLSDHGFALLNCWFVDDLEAEITYLQHVPHNDKLLAALVFSNDQGKGLGANYGSQCALFTQGRSAGGQGKPEPVRFSSQAKIKLVVRDGQFEAWRDGKSKQTMKYSKKTYASGRIGIAWGGSVAGTVPRIEITGKLDYARMAKEMRKAKL
jgi:hypothetical protein